MSRQEDREHELQHQVDTVQDRIDDIFTRVHSTDEEFGCSIEDLLTELESDCTELQELKNSA